MKPRPAVFIDGKLKQRVIQYLTSNRCGKYVDTGILASDLQKMYRVMVPSRDVTTNTVDSPCDHMKYPQMVVVPSRDVTITTIENQSSHLVDYGRRKRNAFRIQVEKVFSIICSEKELKNLKELEDKHLAKRARQDEEDEYTESYSGDDSDMEDYPDPQSANHMNNSLLSLYRKGNSDSVSNTPKLDQGEATTSTPLLTSKTSIVPLKTPARESEGGWFIDKTPGGKKDSHLLDLSDDQSNLKPDSEIQNLKGSLLESDKKRKGRPKGKGNKRKTADLQEVDGEIEAILQKKAKARSVELQISSVKFEDVGGNDATLKELDLPILKVAAPEIVSGVSGESEQKLRDLFDQAVVSQLLPIRLF
ncbi:hypothetical protein U0070_005426 [Myodes glareolus]|uniref:NVL2 nucleolin binding domain-containing protein n=1 Tax=Myodes glareolus TaxID=447135 RepID=A0AAW0HDV1_MYOGA